MIKNKLKPKGAIKDFIWTKENTLSKEFCDHVIKKFDADPSKQDGIVGAKIQRVDKKFLTFGQQECDEGLSDD